MCPICFCFCFFSLVEKLTVGGKCLPSQRKGFFKKYSVHIMIIMSFTLETFWRTKLSLNSVILILSSKNVNDELNKLVFSQLEIFFKQLFCVFMTFVVFLSHGYYFSHFIKVQKLRLTI